jgi:hypothetical protein
MIMIQNDYEHLNNLGWIELKCFNVIVFYFFKI